MTSREEFEAWVTDGGKWPAAVHRTGNHYSLIATIVQWDSWKAARATSPAWHDAPTCAGLWMCKDRLGRYLVTDDGEKRQRWNPEAKYFGPIPQETGT